MVTRDAISDKEDEMAYKQIEHEHELPKYMPPGAFPYFRSTYERCDMLALNPKQG